MKRNNEQPKSGGIWSKIDEISFMTTSKWLKWRGGQLTSHIAEFHFIPVKIILH